MEQKFFVASCVFTEGAPALSRKVQAYVRERFNLPIIRCCVDKYKVAEFEQRMPEDYRDEWRAIKHFEHFPPGSTMVSICHNCSAIFEERHPEIHCESIWKLILSDEKFQYPNHGGEPITVQDCWRSKENVAEQDAVREILRRRGSFNRTPTNKNANSCKNTARKSRRQKSPRIAIIACAV